MSPILRKKEKDEEVNYWQSISDVMAALLLVVLLVMMLFILYMTRMPDVNHIDEFYTSAEDEGAHVDDEWGDRYHSIWWRGGYDWAPGGRYNENGTGYGDGDGRGSGTGDGRGNETGTGPLKGEYEYENYGEGDWEGEQKAAVHVMVRDAETGMSIKEAGITFELYSEKKGLKTLYGYYPQKTEYKSFSTVAGGSFYLPEKIGLGDYHFTEVSVPYGYDLSPDVNFSLEESKDWDDPHLVFVDLFPCRNVIRVQATDEATGAHLAGAVFEVIAAEDIITADGTLRYHAGETVDTVTCDGDGYGESMELYLGEYSLKETTTPEYYAVNSKSIQAFADRKDRDQTAPVVTVGHERTRFNLALRDELYTERGIGPVRFLLRDAGDGTAVEVTTDSRGDLNLDRLKKDTEYELVQDETAQGYIMSEDSIRFRVNSDGRIAGKATEEETLTNRKIRVTIGVQDMLFGSEISDMSMALYNSRKEAVWLWSSNAVPEEIEGLKPGNYELAMKGQSRTIEIEDTKEIQRFGLRIWGTTSMVTLGAGGAGILGLGIAGILFMKKKKKKQRGEG